MRNKKIVVVLSIAEQEQEALFAYAKAYLAKNRDDALIASLNEKHRELLALRNEACIRNGGE